MFKHLSFSSLKAFAESPAEMKRYILKERTESKAMDLGSAVDCKLFTPENFESLFYVCPVIEAKTKDGKVSENPLMTSEGKAKLAEHKELAGNRTFLTQEDYLKVEREVALISNNPVVKNLGLLDSANFQFQFPVEFERTFIVDSIPHKAKHRGITDAYGITADRKDAKGNLVKGETCIWDLKRMSATNGIKSIRYQIKDMMYTMQAAIYSHALQPQKYYLVVLSGINVYVVELNIEAIQSGEVLWSYYATRAIKHRKEGYMKPEIWDIGVEFWSDNSDGTFNF
jgi:hypothetical protein